MSLLKKERTNRGNVNPDSLSEEDKKKIDRMNKAVRSAIALLEEEDLNFIISAAAKKPSRGAVDLGIVAVDAAGVYGLQSILKPIVTAASKDMSFLLMLLASLKENAIRGK